jgi:3-oxoacyl-[acyl-carrier protein] reductase
MSIQYSDLENKKVLVTGATRGIGRELCLALARQKAHVIFNYRSESSIGDLPEQIKQLGGSATGVQFDMSQTDEMKTNIDALIKEIGPIEGLINNAGVSKDQLAMRVKPEDIDYTIDINLKGAMILTNHLTRSFLKAKDVSIVNMSSVVGLMGNTAQTVYAASKAGMIGYTKSYAKELASRKIRINAVCPGFIETDMTKALPEKAQEEYINHIPLGSFGSSEDVANVCCFLLSNASRYITGETIKVDGGLYI